MPYLRDVLPEPGEARFDPQADISEMMELTQPGGGDAFSVEDAEATIVYRFGWKKARSFIRWMLGFSYVVGAPDYKLHRENPQRHPRFPRLTAATIHFTSTAPLPDDSPGGDNQPSFPAVFVEDDGIPKAALYQETWATVRFVTRPWDFRPDSEIVTYADELKRNCYVEPTSTIEMLSAEGPLAQMKWAETGPGAVGEPVVGAALPTPLGMVLAKMCHVLKIMWLPHEYVSTADVMLRPRRYTNCAGTVNGFVFGPDPSDPFQPGTVLMLAPSFQRFRWPVDTADGRTAFYGWNVSVPLVEFVPRPRGGAAAAAADAALAVAESALGLAERGNDADRLVTAALDYSTKLALARARPDGYRLLPWPQNRRFYTATRGDGATYLYRETDHAEILTPARAHV